MNWLTKEEIARRGKISPYEAFTISILKYEQCLRASEEELREAFREGKIGLSTEWCGCCTFWRCAPGICPLSDLHTCSTEGEWSKMETAQTSWFYKQGAFSTFQNTVRTLLCVLYQERDKLPKEEEKQEIRHGDYGIDAAPFICIDDSIYWLDGQGKSCFDPEKFCNTGCPPMVYGNLADDLEALKEPLKEFDLATVKFRMEEDGTLWIGNYVFLPKRLPDLILSLRRLMATKRKQKDC